METPTSDLEKYQRDRIEALEKRVAEQKLDLIKVLETIEGLLMKDMT